MTDSRRLLGVLMTGDGIAAFSRQGELRLKIKSPIPASAQFYTAFFDSSRYGFVVVFEDESFPCVPRGELIPIATLPVVITEYEFESH